MQKNNTISLSSEISIPMAACIEAIGLERFYPRFFSLMSHIAKIEQYMAFELSTDKEILRCCLAHNVHHPDLGLKLVSLYMDGRYKHDPLLHKLVKDAEARPAKPSCELLLRKNLPPVYRKCFFSEPDLTEKFAIMATDEESQRMFYVSFYCSGRRPSFTASEISLLEQSSPLISALLLRHFRGEKPERNVLKHLLIAGLSEREAQICDLVIAGHSAKMIARKLDLAESSITTFRKRAYKKLKIHRKSELLEFLQNK